MTLGRLLRTVRHLSAEQILYSVVRRWRHAWWRRRPDAARARIAAAAAALPVPDPRRPALGQIADHVALLQRTIHPDLPDDLRRGRIRVYGRSLAFDGLSRIEWRQDMGEGNSPLRRLTLAYFGWAVPLLAQGQADDLARVAEALDSLDAAQWSEAGIFRDLWNPYTASHRLINLLCALNLYGRAGGEIGTKAAHRILDHARRCAAFVAADPERDIQANHLFKNWTALAVYASATPEPAAIFPGLTDAVRRGLAQLVLSDGGHAERSPMYHALGLMDLELVLAGGAVPALDVPLREAAERMRQVLALLSHPDGEIALFNDSWLGGAPPPRALNAESPQQGCHALKATGYVRLDGGADVVIFDAGPCALDIQPGHAHADFLSFELSVAGTRLIVDPGTATYTAGELRQQSRSAASHNGPHVMGHEPAEFWQSFRVGRRATAGFLSAPGLEAPAPLWCAGWQDGYRQAGVEVRRWLGLWPGQALLVVDLWCGAPSHRCQSRFLVPPVWTPDSKGNTHRLRGPVDVQLHALAGTLSGPEPGICWPRYEVSEPASVLEIAPAQSGNMRVAALLFRWGQMTTALSPHAVEPLARALAAARPTEQR